jgi:hypothetical protein
LWTLARVAEVIERFTGVRYSQTQTWAVLHERLGWSVQRPARRAVERDEEAIASWVKNDWPRIRKRPAPRRMDRLRRRERILPPARREDHLGARGRALATFRNLAISAFRLAARANIAHARRDLHDREDAFNVFRI